MDFEKKYVWLKLSTHALALVVAPTESIRTEKLE